MKTIAWKIFTSLCLITRKGKYAEFINGIGKMNDKLIIILEISRILQSTEDIKVEDNV